MPAPTFVPKLPVDTAQPRVESALEKFEDHLVVDEFAAARAADLKRLDRREVDSGAALVALSRRAASVEAQRQLLDLAMTHPGALGLDAIAVERAWTTAAPSEEARYAATMAAWSQQGGDATLLDAIWAHGGDRMPSVLDHLQATDVVALEGALVAHYPGRVPTKEALTDGWSVLRDHLPGDEPPFTIPATLSGVTLPDRGFCPTCTGDSGPEPIGFPTPGVAPMVLDVAPPVIMASVEGWLAGLPASLPARLERGGFVPIVQAVGAPRREGDRWTARVKITNVYLSGVLADADPAIAPSAVYLYGETDATISVYLQGGEPTLSVHVSTTRTLASLPPAVLAKVVWLFRIPLTYDGVQADPHDVELARLLRTVLRMDFRARMWGEHA